MRDWINITEGASLSEGFFSGDDDCWIDDEGQRHELDRERRETHRQMAARLLASEGQSIKMACAKGWIRVWIENQTCFLEFDFAKVSRKAVQTCTEFLRKVLAVSKVYIDDSASGAYEDIADIKSAIRRIREISIKRDLNFMFENEEVNEVYSRDNQYLKQTLTGGEFDGYRYWEYAYTWAQQTGQEEEIEEILGEMPDDEEPDQYEQLTPELKASFQQWVEDFLNRNDPSELPSSFYFDSSPVRIPRNTWLVHFTDHAEDIIRSGFTHGVYDAAQLGLTTYQSHDSKKSGGYNFAFLATGRDASWAAQKKKYGRDFVMFQNSGIKTYHYADEENQIIFWGADVDKRHIALVREMEGEYHVLSRTGMTLFKGDFDSTVKWVIANHRQYSRQLYR
jgi:hypothetical protein